VAADTEYLSLEQDEAGVTVLVRMVRPWNEWLITWGYDINEPPPNLDDEMATSIVHSLIGDDSVPVTIRSLSLWGNNKMYAERYREGRVFAVGDAVHRHPPSNRLGSNTSIQHSHNLAWKLAYVLQGKAGEVLRDSFDPERAPVGKQIVLRANKSIEEFGAILDALGLPGRPGRRGDAAQHGIPRRRHRRGCGPPHCWLGREGRKVSTHDVVGKGRFAVLTGITGITGRAWADAARAAADKLGTAVEAVVIGPGCEHTDLYDDWARLREVAEDGCVLVRPDPTRTSPGAPTRWWRTRRSGSYRCSRRSLPVDNLSGRLSLRTRRAVLVRPSLGSAPRCPAGEGPTR
jgi:2,4-dichlorophenol 6-monooxygenase